MATTTYEEHRVRVHGATESSVSEQETAWTHEREEAMGIFSVKICFTMYHSGPLLRFSARGRTVPRGNNRMVVAASSPRTLALRLAIHIITFARVEGYSE
jgi:hypothetical protein